jgi:thiosulfate dehydrogenase
MMIRSVRTALSLSLVLAAAATAGCETGSGPPAAQPVSASTSPAVASPAPGAGAAPGAPAPGAAAAGSMSSSARGTEVLLCDGQTKVNVPDGTPGTAVAGALMSEWMRKNPNSNWEAEERERHTLQSAADNTDLVGQIQGQTYGKVTAQDVALWKAETERTALEGSRIFHSGDELGSTIGVSCDMCHPHAANTHPETYPKFQAQLGRVALLRDMINWCIQHPVRGKALASDDEKMRSLEAYILAQRKGKPLDYGKH